MRAADFSTADLHAAGAYRCATMNEDFIVEETRKAGIELFARFNNDIHAVCEYLRHQSAERGLKTVSLPSHKPDRELSQKKVGRIFPVFAGGRAKAKDLSSAPLKLFS